MNKYNNMRINLYKAIINRQFNLYALPIKMAQNGNDVKIRRHGVGALGSSCPVLLLLPNEVFM